MMYEAVIQKKRKSKDGLKEVITYSGTVLLAADTEDQARELVLAARPGHTIYSVREIAGLYTLGMTDGRK